MVGALNAQVQGMRLSCWWLASFRFPGEQRGSWRARGTWCSCSSFLTALRFLSIPARTECSQFIVYGGFLHTHLCFPLRSVLFPRPTRIPEHGSLACQVQTFTLCHSFLQLKHRRVTFQRPLCILRRQEGRLPKNEKNNS